MIELSRQETAAIQLSVFDRFQNVCADHNLTYFLYYGTLIGALRHRGFIPWDDDIDIAMPRDDYDKLREINWGQADLGLISPTVIANCPYVFSKIYDLNSSLVEHADHSLTQLGINIDIFPIDHASENPLLMQCQQKLIAGLLWLISFKVVRLSERRGRLRDTALRIGKKLLAAVPVGLLTRQADRLAAHHRQPGRVAGCRVGIYRDREQVEREHFAAVVLVDFEGRQVPAPVGYDAILTRIYGDYMTPPPTEKRITTHMYRAFARRKEEPSTLALRPADSAIPAQTIRICRE